MSRTALSSGFPAAWRHEWHWLFHSRWGIFMTVGLPLIVVGIIAWIFSPGLMTRLPIAVIDADHSEISRLLIRRLEAAEVIDIVAEPVDLLEAQRWMRRGKIYAIVYVPRDTAKDVAQGLGGKIFVYFNQAYYSVGSQLRKGADDAISAVNGVLAGAARDQSRAGESPDSAESPVKVQAITLFNPTVNFEQSLEAVIHPAILHLLALCTMVYAIGRERDRGLRYWPCAGSLYGSLGGKLLPYILIYTCWCALSLLWLYGIRGFSPLGNPYIVVTGQLLMMSAYAAFAILFVALGDTTTQALSFGSLFAGPALAYGNVLFPVINTPLFVRFWSLVMPYTTYIRLQVQQLEMGAPLRDALPLLMRLLAFIVILTPLATLLLRRRLRRDDPEPAGQNAAADAQA